MEKDREQREARYPHLKKLREQQEAEQKEWDESKWRRIIYMGQDPQLSAPVVTLGLGAYPFRRGSTRYWDPDDLNGARSANFTAYCTYTQGLVKLQAGTIYSAFGEGPESQQTAAARLGFPSSDTSGSEGWLYALYQNGTIEWHTELDWYYRTVRYQRSANGTFMGTPDNADGSGSLFAPRFVESWRFATKLAAVRGPYKLTLQYTRMPGPDRRHGILIDKQPFIQERDQGALSVFLDFSALMAGTYSGGVRGFGDIPDASTFAARFDYAMAANLNIYGRVLKANRVSHGYGWGYIRPTIAPGIFGTVNYADRGSFSNPSPAIPDNDLGWEFGAGVIWELLKDWSVSLDVDWWQPGRWFNFACVDRSVTNWDVPTAANMFGIKPDRRIDPVMAFNLSVTAEF